jgi:hypothetical protein
MMGERGKLRKKSGLVFFFFFKEEKFTPEFSIKKNLE